MNAERRIAPTLDRDDSEATGGATETLQPSDDTATLRHATRQRVALRDARLPDRFWSKVVQTGECWLWTACRNPNGYGMYGLFGRSALAHQVAYEWLAGPIPDGLELDHTCRRRACVNPAHLEAVTHRENIVRGVCARRAERQAA